MAGVVTTGPKGPAFFFGLWFCAGFCASGSVSAGSIVSDGGTATVISTVANGRQLVDIAPAVSGVSHNTYSQFNVGRAGASLNNVGVNARNIVNQVTGTNPSLIQGDIAVLGPRANVILANPNGITVNGGRFINTGHVALTTGRVSFHDFIPAPGLAQRNIVLDTSQGQIVIGPDGLSGAMLNLELIAKSLVVNGPVANSFSASSAGIRGIVGDSRAEIDGGLSPTDNLTPWIAYSTPNTKTPLTAIDITPLGSLTAGRIALIVTDQGAGVRHAGAMYANVGDFTVSASGDIDVAGGTLRAQQHLQLNAGSLTLTAGWHGQRAVPAQVTSESGTVSIASTGAVRITGSEVNGMAGVTVNGASLTMAAIRNTDGSALQRSLLQSKGGAVALNTAEAIGITGSDVLAATGLTVSSAGFILQNDGAARSTATAVNGGVVIDSRADIINRGSLIQGSTRLAGNGLSQGAVTLLAKGKLLNQSPDADTLAVIFGVNDDVHLQSGGDIVNHHGRILSNKALRIAAVDDVRNIVDKQTGSDDEQAQTAQTNDTRWLMLRKRTNRFFVDYGQVERPDQLSYLVSYTGTTISGRNILNLGGVILANNAGDITIDADQTFHNEALFSGQAQFRRSCLIFCRANASSTVRSVGGNLVAGGHISIRAGVSASNKGGTVTATRDLTVTAPTVLAQGAPGYRAYGQNKGFKSWFGDRWARLYAMDVGGNWTAATGKLAIHGRAVINGGTFDGVGGITATDGVLTLRSAQRNPVTIERHLGLTSWLWH